MTTEVYVREPRAMAGAVPAFSDPSASVVDYARIAHAAMRTALHHGATPFVPEDLWREFEASTAALVAQHARPGDRVLAIGVGPRRLLACFPAVQRYAMDISFGQLERSVACGIELCYGQIEDMPYAPGVFDIVVCTDVLEQAPDLNRTCATILSTLKPGGTVIVRVPHAEDLSRYVARDYPCELVHFHRFSVRTLVAFFAKVFGCVPVEVLLAGYDVRYSRLRVPGPRPALAGLLRVLGAFRPQVRKTLLKRLCEPLVINAAFTKPSWPG